MTKATPAAKAKAKPDPLPLHPFTITLTLSGKAAFRGTIQGLAQDAANEFINQSGHWCEHVIQWGSLNTAIDFAGPTQE